MLTNDSSIHLIVILFIGHQFFHASSRDCRLEACGNPYWSFALFDGSRPKIDENALCCFFRIFAGTFSNAFWAFFDATLFALSLFVINRSHWCQLKWGTLSLRIKICAALCWKITVHIHAHSSSAYTKTSVQVVSAQFSYTSLCDYICVHVRIHAIYANCNRICFQETI